MKICSVLPENWGELLRLNSTPFYRALWLSFDWLALFVGYAFLAAILAFTGFAIADSCWEGLKYGYKKLVP